MKRWVCVGSVLCVLVGAAWASVGSAGVSRVEASGVQAVDRAGWARVDEAVTEEAERQGLVGLAWAVVLVDEAGDAAVAHEGYHGYADRARRVRVSGRTMFRWASISKPLTAVAALRLAADGALDLDADVRTYVPEYPEQTWDGEPVVVTARQLLGHLGGIVHYSNGPVVGTEREYAEPNPYADVVNALDTFNRSPLVAAPGTEYAYTTRGYMLLSAVVERAAGEAYAAHVRRTIARPIGARTLVPDYQWLRIPNRAVGYRAVGEGDARLIVESTDFDVSWKLGGGGWISTVGDLGAFAAALLGDELLSEAQKAAAWTEQTTAAGEGTGYGLGFTVSEMDGRRVVMHTGSQEKSRCAMLLLPDDGLGVVVMSNSEFAQVSRVSRVLLDAVDDALAADGGE